MFRQYRFFASNILFFLALVMLLPNLLWAYKASDFSWIPPFLARDEMPSTTIILDNSGSMFNRAYTDQFNSTKEYYGYFDPKTYYTYNTSGYFQPNNATGTWNGNFLNWASMHRIDVARKVLTGGKYTTSGRYEFQYPDGSSDDTDPRVPPFTYNANTQVTDLNNATRYMTPYRSNVTIKHNISSWTWSGWVVTNGLYIGSDRYQLFVESPSKTGVIDQFSSKTRMSLFLYYRKDGIDSGGIMRQSMTATTSGVDAIKTIINNTVPSTNTPLAETLYTVIGYIQQINTNLSEDYTTKGPKYFSDSYGVSTTEDPYYFPAYSSVYSCTDQNIIFITDGESTADQDIPNARKNNAPSPFRRSYSMAPTYYAPGSDYLQDIAYWGHTTDLRTGTGFGGYQSINLFTVFASFGSSGSEFLRRSTYFGSFKDKNGDGILNSADLAEADFANPENYFEANSGQELEASIAAAFQAATSAKASGTSAAVASQRGDGDGAAYQAVFFPPSSNPTAPAWSGQVHAYFLDGNSNLREDTNSNRRLDLIGDKIISFANDKVYTYTDTNGDTIINNSENATQTELASINSINFLWSSSPWLNGINDTNIIQQRASYNSTSPERRYIFTFVDKNSDMIANATNNEVQPFVLSAVPATTTLKLHDYFYNHLTLYESQSGSLALGTTAPQSTINSLRSNTTAFNNYQAALAKRQVDFIRGANVGNATNVGGSTISDTVRSRTWRLGDIIYSSPTVVSRPAENYHLLYNDNTYSNFINKYKNRRQVAYVGANDGMLHAFNGGFYNSTNGISFGLTRDGKAGFALGAELWAYVPYNLLPHLRWLMDPNYGTNLHVSYMDLKPRVFDARVFFNPGTMTPTDANTYPDGWGTIMVAGMRLGGAHIGVDVNKNLSANRNATSAYVVMDITDPEQPPKLLAEITMPNQGFTTCYPTLMPMTKRNASAASENQWYLVFGSGPADAAGYANPTRLHDTTSLQNGRLYVVDLKALVADKQLKSVNSSKIFASGAHAATIAESASFISGPAAVDFGIGSSNSSDAFTADAVYYGTTAGSETTGLGRMYRLVTRNSNSPLNWTLNSTVIDVGKPIPATPTISKDDDGRIWIFFGTGRYYNNSDTQQTSRMTFYGIKEPVTAGTRTWGTVSSANLFNSTRISIGAGTCGSNPKYFTKNCVQITNATVTSDWDTLVNAVRNSAGWRQDFSPAYERTLGQPAVFRGAVLFTTYTPTNEVCSGGGNASLWGLYYKTGTPYYKPIFGVVNNVIIKSVDVGRGPASGPSIHLGKDGKVSGLVQSGNAGLVPIAIEPPYGDPSGPLYWRQNFN